MPSSPAICSTSAWKPCHLVGQLLVLGLHGFEFGRRNGFVGRIRITRPHVAQGHFTAEPVRPAAFSLAGRARQLHDVRRVVLGQFFQKRFNGRDVCKRVQPRGVQAQLGGRLRTAQQQRGEKRHGLARHAEHAAHVVLEARHAAAAAFHHEAQRFQSVDGGEDFRFSNVHHRRACGLLVAAGNQRVECERIGVGHRVLLLDQDAEHAALESGERPDGADGGT